MGPSGSIGTSWVTGGVVLASGANPIFAPTGQFTPAANETCVISSSVILTPATFAAGSGGANIAIKVNGAFVGSNGLGGGFMSDVTGSELVANSSLGFPVTAGTAYQFGCYVSVTGDFVGKSAKCVVNWICY